MKKKVKAELDSIILDCQQFYQGNTDMTVEDIRILQLVHRLAVVLRECK